MNLDRLKSTLKRVPDSARARLRSCSVKKRGSCTQEGWGWGVERDIVTPLFNTWGGGQGGARVGGQGTGGTPPAGRQGGALPPCSCMIRLGVPSRQGLVRR